MSPAQISEALAHWGRHITFHRSDNAALFQRAEHENGWFTQASISMALDAITQDMLDAGQLHQFHQAGRIDVHRTAHEQGLTLWLCLSTAKP